MQQQMQQMEKSGEQMSNSTSEEFARMAAEQEMLRQGMQQMLKEMKENGQIGDDGLNEIIKDMEKLEEELVNKKINRQMIERSQRIFLRTNPIEYAPYYKDKINEYYLKKNTH